MIIQKILQGAVLDIVQKKLVDKLASNKQFQQMSVQFKDKIEEFTGEKPPKRNIHDHHHHNHHHSGAHSNTKHNKDKINFQSTKYTNDIHENARIYEQQRRLQQQQNSSSYNSNDNSNSSSNKNKPQNKNFFSHLYDGFKEEFNDEVDKLNGKKK
ncbi:hypothetical protein RB653_005761 [Dictyostelium firmibasis]|uniref:Uncharacterized protein n=1 Tax=Dictyostelium firmibasis TaxID=79012 RepID=A0AAN7U1X5_9MYCE